MSNHYPIDPLTRRELALAAFVDERTLRKFLDGKPVRPLTHRRIIDAARRLHLEMPVDCE